MSRPLKTPEITFPFPEESSAAYGLFLLTNINQLSQDLPHYTGNIVWAVQKAVREWETDGAGEDRVVVNRRNHELFRASTLLLSPHIPKMLDLMMKKHEKQKRKGDGADYREHPLEVAHILRQHGFGADEITAGLGHDLFEDTNASELEVYWASGKEPLRLIKAMTQPKMDDWYAKKMKHVDQIRTAGEKAAAVFAADHIANLRAMTAGYQAMGEPFWNNFNAGKEGRLWYENLGYDMVAEMLGDHTIVKAYSDHRAAFETLDKELR